MITKDLDKVEASACKPAIFSARFTVKTFDQTGCRKKPDLELEITPSGLTIRQTSSNNNVLQGKNPKPETVGKEPVPWSQVKAGYHKLDFNMSKKVWNIPITSVLKASIN